MVVGKLRSIYPWQKRYQLKIIYNSILVELALFGCFLLKFWAYEFVLELDDYTKFNIDILILDHFGILIVK